MSFGNVWDSLVDLFSDIFAPKDATSIGKITAITYDTQGRPVSATASTGRSANETVDLSLGQGIAVGDRVLLTGPADPIGRRWTIKRTINSSNTLTGKAPGRPMPTVVTRGVRTWIDTPSTGGYVSRAAIRYDMIRRGSYDLPGMGIPTMRARYRMASQAAFSVGPIVTHWPYDYTVTGGYVRTTLASGCTAGDTTIALTPSATPELYDDIPVSLDDTDSNEKVYILVDDEIMSGWYHADGSLTGVTRGVENVGTLGTAVAHLAGVAVLLLSADYYLPPLAPGQDYEAQLQPVDQYYTYGPFVPVGSTLDFTSANIVTAPAAVDGTYMAAEIVANNYEIKWRRVTTDATATSIADQPLYQIRRLSKGSTPSTDPTNADWTSATKLNSSGASANEELVSNPYVLWPIGQGSGEWFGVRTVRRSSPDNVYAATITWQSDTTAPTRPTLANVDVLPTTEGFEVRVDPADAVFSDRGFYALKYYAASDASGSDLLLMATTFSNTYVRQSTPGITIYVQVVAVDRAGNANAIDNAYWQAVTPGWPPPPWPVNGQFETADIDGSSVSFDALGTFLRTGAVGWYYASAVNDYYARVDDVGIWGGAAMKLHHDHTNGTLGNYLISNEYPILSLAGVRTLVFFVRSSQTVTDFTINFIEYRRYGGGFHTASYGGVTVDTSTTWQKVTVELTLSDQNGGYGSLIIDPSSGSPTFANGSIDTDFYFDGMQILEAPYSGIEFGTTVEDVTT